MISKILIILTPILIRLVAWTLDYIKSRDQTKRMFYQFITAWELERGVPVKLKKSIREQMKELQRRK